MGTYTTNYQLYIPTVGEQGWGTLVNGNFTTIDATMKGLSNRITAVENGINGKVNISTYATSGDITLGVLSFPNSSIATTALLTSNSCTCGTATFTKKNTSLINYTGSTPSNNATATVTVTFKNNTTNMDGVTINGYVTVKNNTTGATIISNKSVSVTYVNKESSRTVTVTFTRVPTNTYTVTVVGNSVINSSGSTITNANELNKYFAYSVSVTTSGTTTYYVP